MRSENNMMTEMLYWSMIWTIREENQSRAAKTTTNNNIWKCQHWGGHFPCSGQKWLKHGCRPIHCGSMVTMINRVWPLKYNVDPYLNAKTSCNHEDIHSGFTTLSRHNRDQIQSGSMWPYNYSIATWVLNITKDNIPGSSISHFEWHNSQSCE